MKLKLLIFLFSITATSLFAQEKIKEEIMVNVPFSKVALSPVHPACKGTLNEDLKTCTRQTIDQLLYSNFNKALLKRTDKQVGIQFTISPYGEVTKIRTTTQHPHLQEEAERLVGLLPKFTPGENRGRKVAVLYTSLLDFSEELNKKYSRQSKRNKS